MNDNTQGENSDTLKMSNSDVEASKSSSLPKSPSEFVSEFFEGRTPLSAFSAAVTLVFVIVMVIKSFGAIYQVDAGHIGIRTKLGKLQPEPMAEGMHFINPFFDEVYQMNIKIQEVRAECDASSQDLQKVEAEVSLQYYVVEIDGPNLYKNLGGRDEMSEMIIQPAMQESVKSVTSMYTADKLITGRERVKADIKSTLLEFIQNTLKPKELSHAIKIANVAITDFRFSDMFNDAIESKVEAEQEALKAENEKMTAITNAEATASEKKLAASAYAYQVNETASARAHAITQEAAALSDQPELITLRKIERWDGQLPKLEASTDENGFSSKINKIAGN